MSFQCRVIPRGAFHTYSLYRMDGSVIADIKEAAKEAEEQFGSDWQEVFNGADGISRAEFVSQ
jgi:hypothetical protein